MSDIDWSKAPEWATRFCHVGMNRLAAWANDTQYTYVVGGLAGRIFKIGTDEGFPESAMHTIECSPAAWTGTGLPPVGATVEYKSFRDQWKQGTYVGQFRDQIVIGCHESGVVGICESAEIRPIRTPEQIAAEERVKEIDRIERILSKQTGMADSNRHRAAVLYDEGLRFKEAP